MGRFGLSQPVLRSEDRRFLTGAGRYSADIDLPAQAHAVILRSQHAHAQIRSIDAAEALAVPGVLAVVTAPDLAGLAIFPAPCRWKAPADSRCRAPAGRCSRATASASWASRWR